ncbi:hypothetical protein HPB48_003035 [Haemaphysalis longicornis]|uniref:Uncharacterized protein n=1 Tax=Haemaphysalis longicornis TaxID=44386 RepID=A0A9J6FPI2_HAELO|nr:hypothetical protein HPB48_003035 [Haemaphysalis longicornis]
MRRQQSSLLFLNNPFDALNRRFPGEGLTLGCKDFLVIESASKWLDEWEQEVVNGDIPKDFFSDPVNCRGTASYIEIRSRAAPLAC